MLVPIFTFPLLKRERPAGDEEKVPPVSPVMVAGTIAFILEQYAAKG